MKLLKEHQLIQLNATKEQVKEVLGKTSFRAVKRTLTILTGEHEKLLRKGRNIEDLLEFPLEEVIATYNVVALTINYNVERALEIIKNIIEYVPQLIKIKDVKDLKDLGSIFAEADEQEEEETL